MLNWTTSRHEDGEYVRSKPSRSRSTLVEPWAVDRLALVARSGQTCGQYQVPALIHIVWTVDTRCCD
jgi:hypothetical protein